MLRIVQMEERIYPPPRSLILKLRFLFSGLLFVYRTRGSIRRVDGLFAIFVRLRTGLTHFASISCVQFFSPGSGYLFCDTRSQMKRWRFSVYYRFVYGFSRSFQLSFFYIGKFTF